MKKLSKSEQHGYISLLAVLAVTAIITLFSVAIQGSAITDSKVNARLNNSFQALAYADICTAKALSTFKPSYYIGTVRGPSYNLRNSLSAGSSDIVFDFGIKTEIPIVGDWNKDKVSTVGRYDSVNSVFSLRNSLSSGGADIVFTTPIKKDGAKNPITGDFDGDGYTTTGVFVDTTKPTFYIKNSNVDGLSDYSFIFGNQGDIPITGDWDGDGVTSIGLYRPLTNTFYLKNSNSSGKADINFVLGNTGDIPITGDWDGDGVTSIGLYRPSTNTYYLKNANASGSFDYTFNFGNSGDLPISGAWLGIPGSYNENFSLGNCAYTRVNTSGKNWIITSIGNVAGVVRKVVTDLDLGLSDYVINSQQEMP